MKQEFQKKLTPSQRRVLAEKGTDRPFTGQFLHNDKSGEYSCVACGNVLFNSNHKFDSGSGWPSFYDVAATGSVELKNDDSHGMIRTEVVCAKCGGHLGHVFDDAVDQPGGKRYCINGTALAFTEKSTS
jgi:peptide-methionine (R)-S-oxide reductase